MRCTYTHQTDPTLWTHDILALVAAPGRPIVCALIARAAEVSPAVVTEHIYFPHGLKSVAEAVFLAAGTDVAVLFPVRHSFTRPHLRLLVGLNCAFGRV